MYWSKLGFLPRASKRFLEKTDIFPERGCSSVWLERLPVTQEVASSSLVNPAFLLSKIIFTGIFWMG